MPDISKMEKVGDDSNTWQDTETEMLYAGRPGQTIESILAEAASADEDWARIVAAMKDVPETISDRQFFQQLAIDGMITDDEALSAVKTGDMPATMQAFIAALPATDQFAAKMVLCGATSFQRSHLLVATFGAANGMTGDQIDDLWIAAAKL
ncbi:hypothetical protein G6L00_16580 [Agrobacterium rhizogenes]|nr:hypothetical protein [Rhizobium rhizogenes]